MTTTPEVSRYVDALPIAMIRESETNPRKTYDPKKLQELADSIKANPLGVVEPLVLQELDDGKGYELIAGSRRLRAAKLAGLAAVPARIAKLTEEQVLEIQLIENLQREDVHPIEEAEGYARLMKIDPEYTAERIAERVGKDRSYVYKRLTLTKLSKAVKDAFLAGRITIGHALEISALGSPTDQATALEACFRGDRWAQPTKEGAAQITVGQLQRYIREDILLNLGAAPWKKDDAELVRKAGSCAGCLKRTGASPMLFDDLPKGDFCTDSTCYAAKRAAFIQLAIDEGKKEGKTVLRVSSENQYMHPAAPKGVLTKDDYRQVSKKDLCDHAEAAVVVHGRGRIGEKITICRTKDCKGHWRASSYSREAAPKPSAAEQLKRRRELLNQRIEAEARREGLRALAAARSPKVLRMILFLGHRLLDRLHHDDQRELCAAFEIEPKKQQYSTDYRGPLKAWLKGKKPDAVLPFFVACASTHAYNAEKYMTDAAELMGIDLAALEKRVAAPLREKFEASVQKAAAKKAPAKKAKASPAETAAKKKVAR